MCSALARERSRKVLPMSVVARSISWLMQRVPSRVWTVSARARTHPLTCVCVPIWVLQVV